MSDENLKKTVDGVVNDPTFDAITKQAAVVAAKRIVVQLVPIAGELLNNPSLMTPTIDRLSRAEIERFANDLKSAVVSELIKATEMAVVLEGSK